MTGTGSNSEEDFFYNRIARAIIPAGEQTETGEKYYEDIDWTSMKIKLTEKDLIYEKRGKKGSIRVDDIYYIDRVFQHPKADSPKVLSFNYQTDEGDFVALIRNRTTRSKEILKKRLLRQIIKDANIWYISPRSVGSETSINQGWNEGIFKIGAKNTLRIEDTDGEIVTTIPPEDVIRLNPITKRKRVNLKIFYWREGEVQVDLVYSTEIPLELVTDFFYSDYLEEEKRKREKQKDLSIDEMKILKALKEKEEEKEDSSVTTPEEEFLSELPIEAEKGREVLSSLESEELVCRRGSKVFRTFKGVESTPEEIEEEEEDEDRKELKKKAEKLKKRLKTLKAMKEKSQ